ncbi:MULTISPECIES: DUF6059 family protein [Streptomyces]|uniref:Uncharacterized protein n=1 Tax=Streptomyces venezuelae TaxID=54571 RepID=A0A5P2AW49_STRVZ|nr:DUF6059 family protein [Streptomyces venezuelae]QES22522.1 hypothetical protein DEJ46_28305 [Streptomyces venezuelae]
MHGVLNHALRHVILMARGCYRALVAFGSLWLPLPEDQLRRILYGQTEEHAPGTEDHSPETGPGPGTTATAVATAPTPPTPAGPYRDSTGNPAGHGATGPAAARTPARRATGRTAGSLSRTPPGPPPGHPERLCVEVPLSELEKGLARQLKGV